MGDKSSFTFDSAFCRLWDWHGFSAGTKLLWIRTRLDRPSAQSHDMISNPIEATGQLYVELSNPMGCVPGRYLYDHLLVGVLPSRMMVQVATHFGAGASYLTNALRIVVTRPVSARQ